MRRRRQTIIVSTVGVAVVVIYAGLAALQILVFTPLAAAPGLSLAEVKAEMHSAGESLNEASTISILAIGPLIAVVVAAIAVRARAHPAIPAITLLIVLMLGGPGLFVASFGPGMGMADTFMVAGGIFLPGVMPFFVVSVIAGVALTVGVILAATLARGPARLEPASRPSV